VTAPAPALLLLAPAWPAGGSAAVEQANKAKHESPLEIRMVDFMVITSGISAWSFVAGQGHSSEVDRLVMPGDSG